MFALVQAAVLGRVLACQIVSQLLIDSRIAITWRGRPSKLAQIAYWTMVLPDARLVWMSAADIGDEVEFVARHGMRED